MKVELRLEPEQSEVTVVVRAPALTPEVEALLEHLKGREQLIGLYPRRQGHTPGAPGHPPVLWGGQGGPGPDGGGRLYRAPAAL